MCKSHNVGGHDTMRVMRAIVVCASRDMEGREKDVVVKVQCLANRVE
jgi:hypothetical protein